MSGHSDNTTRVGHHASSSRSALSHRPVLRRLDGSLSPSHPALTIGTNYVEGSTGGGPPIVCFYCRQPRDVMTRCPKKLAKISEKPSEGASVRLLSTISGAPVVDSATEPIVKQKKPTLDPRFEQHCSPAQLVRPDTSVKQVRLLWDTGALQSLICSRVLTDHDYKPTDEFRLIRGITSNVISVPLVEVTLSSSLSNGIFLCGLVSTLPEGIAGLVGNDICTDIPVADLAIVTRSQTAQARQLASQTTAASVDTTDTSSVIDQAGLPREPHETVPATGSRPTRPNVSLRLTTTVRAPTTTVRAPRRGSSERRGRCAT